MPAQSFLMIPDSVSDRIVLFDAQNGSLIDDNFIDGSEETGLGIFQTPLNTVQVNQEIWVSDQIADAIFRFDLEGNYLSIVGDNDGDGDTDGLDNIRGIEFVNDLVYVANGGAENNAPGDGEVVVVFDKTGNNLGFFDTGDPFDIRAYNGELLINDINSESSGGEDIDRYSIDGINSTFLGTFVESDGETGIDFPQQITLRESNGNILVGGFSRPGGIYEYDIEGNQVNFFDASAGFANIVRAAYELDNGEIIWSGGDGVIVTDPNTGEDRDIYTVNTLDFRPSARYIEPLIIPEEGIRNVDGAIFLADQTLDKLYITQDLSGDGDANDPLEVSVYFDETNASGLADPTKNIFTILQGDRGQVFYGDGETDTVYRLVDLNRDGDANDAGEATVWFDANNAEGLPLLTPNGLAQGSDGAIYVVEADTVGTPNGDFVYRTQDLNHDGDANDANESSIWLDLKALNSNSSPFEITFIDDVAYIIDSVGTDTNVIYRAEDTNSNGSIETDEVTVLIDETTIPIDFALTTDGESLFTVELLDFNESQSVFKIEDGETVTTTEVWNSTAVPNGFELSASFSIAANPEGELVITSNGGDANEDNLFRLVDLNSDGDYFDDGETIPYLSRLLTSNVPDRARVVEYAKFNPPPEPRLGTNNNDILIGTNEDDILIGLSGNDLVRARAGNDSIDGNNGSDRALGGDGKDTIVGGRGKDTLLGNSSNDSIDGNNGSDRLLGGEGNDLLSGGNGRDTLLGEAGNDSLNGGNQKDLLRGDGGDDTIFGGSGQDTLLGEAGNDILEGGNSSDRLLGGEGNDSVFGSRGRDTLLGEAGDDLLSGDAGDDRILGGDGNDLLMGVTGNDTLIGEGGSDTFVFGNGDGTDVVVDFERGVDNIGLVEGELTFDELSIFRRGQNLILDVVSTGERLAIVRGVNSGTIGEDDFVTVPDISDISDVL